VSSTYRILCLSHDPALVIDTPDWNRPEPAEAAIRDGIDGHRACDLMIGRYSYPLVGLGCPPSRDQPATMPCCHGITMWTDKDWLLLLAASYQSDDPDMRKAIERGSHQCLPWERLRRLRVELDVELRESP
jgi:hypothetical protein